MAGDASRINGRKGGRPKGSRADGLTPKQARFVSEYLIDLNATQAAIRAGYSARNADKIGPELLGKTRVREAIASAQGRILTKLELDAEDCIRANADIVGLDPLDLFGPDGNLRALKDIPVAVRRCIKKIRVHKQNLTSGDGKTDKVVEYEFLDKHAALDRDYKRLGLSKERIDLRVSTWEELVNGSWDRDAPKEPA